MTLWNKGPPGTPGGPDVRLTFSVHELFIFRLDYRYYSSPSTS
jgi:hypothetical protein